MPETTRKAILDNIVTTLQGITVAAGFNLTVSLVERGIRDYDDIDISGLPWLGYIVGPETTEYFPTQFIHNTMPVVMLGYVSGTTINAQSENIELLQDDITVAMHNDGTRGGFAISSTISQTRTNEGEIGAPVGVLEMTWTILYERDIRVTSV